VGDKERRYYAAHREEVLERARKYREANRELLREKSRRYEEEHRESRRERFKSKYAADPERWRQKTRDWRAANPEKAKAFGRKHGDRTRHGAGVDRDRARMWEAQGGRCYLCSDALDPEDVNIDHDHECCPRNRSCSYCRRGLACGRCNLIIGHAGDDPDLLELIASKLRPVLAATKARMAEKPQQMGMFSA